MASTTSESPDLSVFMDTFLTVTTIYPKQQTDREKFDTWRQVMEFDPHTVKEHLYERLCKMARIETETLRKKMQAEVDADNQLAMESLRDSVQTMPADSAWFEIHRSSQGSHDLVLAQYEAARAAVRAAMQLLLEKWKAGTTATSWDEVQQSLDAAVNAGLTAAQRNTLAQEMRTFVQMYSLWLKDIAFDLSEEESAYLATTVEDHEQRYRDWDGWTSRLYLKQQLKVQRPEERSMNGGRVNRWLRWPRALRVRVAVGEAKDPWVRGCEKYYPVWSVPHEDLLKIDAEVQQAMLRATADLVLRDLDPYILRSKERLVKVILFLKDHDVPDASIDAAIDRLICNNAECNMVTKCRIALKCAKSCLADVVDRIVQHVCATPIQPSEAVELLRALDGENIQHADDSIARLLQYLLSNTSPQAWSEHPIGNARQAAMVYVKMMSAKRQRLD